MGVRFVEGDAQKLPFPDDSADLIVSRGTLTFIPDIAQCLREVRRVLKPTGTAFLGGRYLYTPQADKITTLYPKDVETQKALKRIRSEKLENRIACKTGTIHDLPFEDASFDLVAGVGPILLWGDREKGMTEVHRVLKNGGAALIGGKFLGMPKRRRTPSETLRTSAEKTGIPHIRISEDRGQWVEIRKGTKDRGLRD